ncbi:MAG: ACT domain-containing protein [Candidatus Sulfotelmatobacter sp.]
MLKFHQLPGPYAIVRLDPNSSVPDWATNADFTSITRTADELSIVCPLANLPANVQSQLRWICLKLEGSFPFSQTGILLSFIAPLSNNGVPIFAISTYDTDYVLLPEEFAELALRALSKGGHELFGGQ